ncbi:hypothetical protein H6P81_014578 [Aristolochia fimbriata]|uniref:Uncharacterized protein n=1 Tax=Aristolochia fimbriata TaxID=158543 RepID=A0AAV7E7I6_ARIFI|nr:hypothetical protein H6P81_014578 [Aristolochia fimbriata]
MEMEQMGVMNMNIPLILPRPVRYKRATAALDDRARARLYDQSRSSSGSEHSAAAVRSSSPLDDDHHDLAHLVDSFIEYYDDHDDGCCEVVLDVLEQSTHDQRHDELLDLQHGCRTRPSTPSTTRDEKKKIMKKKKQRQQQPKYDTDETSSTLERLLIMSTAGASSSIDQERILAETERAMVRPVLVGDGEEGGLVINKRALMAHLRNQGLDAGLCKSRWEKCRIYPGGSYEYIDVVLAGGQRYIVETNLAAQFHIARPTPPYLALLALFPPVFVAKQEALERLVRLMCAAAKHSLNTTHLHLPPWRRARYVLAKWFGPYKRTTNINNIVYYSPITTTTTVPTNAATLDVGFEPPMLLPPRSARCRQAVAEKKTLKITGRGGNNMALI